MKISRKQQLLKQLNILNTYNLVKNDLIDIATNVYWFNNLPTNIDSDNLNNWLFSYGAVAFFYDDVLKEVTCLPFYTLSKDDNQGNPKAIVVYSPFNSYKRILISEEFVIMYDNTRKSTLENYVIQTSLRLAQIKRVKDINLKQQATPRFWNTKNQNLKTLEDMLSDIDTFEDTIITYNQIDFDETTCSLAPAPYLLDKLDLHEEIEYNKFLRKVGVASMTYQKRERNIKDEIVQNQGGTLVSRNFRLNSRLKATEKINKKWGLKIDVMYFDFYENENYNLTENEKSESESDSNVL